MTITVCVQRILVAVAPKASLNLLLGGRLGLFVGSGCVSVSPVAENGET